MNFHIAVGCVDVDVSRIGGLFVVNGFTEACDHFVVARNIQFHAGEVAHSVFPSSGKGGNKTEVSVGVVKDTAT